MRIGRSAVAWLVLVLAMPSVAAAGTVGQVQGELVTTYSGDEQADNVSVTGILVLLNGVPHTDHRFTSSPVAFGTGACSTTLGSMPHVDCPGPGVRLVFNLEDGSDAATTAALGAESTMHGGAGADRLTGSSARDQLFGGGGDDILQPAAGDGTVDGGPGDDRVELIAGSVVVAGGEGRDFVQFNAAASTVSLDGLVNDSFGSNVEVDVEDVDGGAAGDTITGSAAANRLRGMSGDDTLTGGDGNDEIDGGPGNDVIDAGRGTDTVNGGDGDDTIGALDGVADTITCGNGTDTVQADAQDSLAADCADSIVPSGGPAPAVCVPTGPDRPANGIDEDCSGRDARLRRNRAHITNVWVSFTDYTVVSALRFTDLPRGARVRVSCRGRGCPFKRKLVKVENRRANATKLFSGARLALGTRVEVRITARDTMGKVVRYTMRSRKIPAKRTLCLTPGKSRPGRC
jgi:hemolysin type calcium-binding protein